MPLQLTQLIFEARESVNVWLRNLKRELLLQLWLEEVKWSPSKLVTEGFRVRVPYTSEFSGKIKIKSE